MDDGLRMFLTMAIYPFAMFALFFVIRLITKPLERKMKDGRLKRILYFSWGDGANRKESTQE